MKLHTKIASLAVAASTAGLLGFAGVTTAAHATCGSAQAGSGTVYDSGAPSPGSPGYVGVSPQSGDYVQASGSASASGVSGDITAAGSAPAGSGGISIGNDGQQSSGVGGTPVPSNPLNAGACAG